MADSDPLRPRAAPATIAFAAFTADDAALGAEDDDGDVEAEVDVAADEEDADDDDTLFCTLSPAALLAVTDEVPA